MKIYGVVGFEMKNNGNLVVTKHMIIGADIKTGYFWGESIVEDKATADKLADTLNMREEWMHVAMNPPGM